MKSHSGFYEESLRNIDLFPFILFTTKINKNDPALWMTR